MCFLFFVLVELAFGVEFFIPPTDHRHTAPTLPVEIGWLETGEEDNLLNMHESVVMNAFIDVRSRNILVPSFLVPGDAEYQVVVFCLFGLEGDEYCYRIPRVAVEFYDDEPDGPVVLGLAPGSFFHNIFRSLTISPMLNGEQGNVLTIGPHDPQSLCAANSTLSNVALMNGNYFGLRVGVDCVNSDASSQSIVSTISDLDWIPRPAWSELISELQSAGMEVRAEDQHPAYPTYITRIDSGCDLSRFPILWYSLSGLDAEGLSHVIDIALYPDDYTTQVGVDGCIVKLLPDDEVGLVIGWNLVRNVVTHFGDDYIAFCDPPES